MLGRQVPQPFRNLESCHFIDNVEDWATIYIHDVDVDGVVKDRVVIGP